MEALLARSVQTLRGRFEALRPYGPIPALMAESPIGHKTDFPGTPLDPVPPFPTFNRPDRRYLGPSCVMRDGKPAAVRDLWLTGESGAIGRLQGICADAAGFAPAVREHYGLPRNPGAHSQEDWWIWSVFELAELGFNAPPLRLKPPAVQLVAGREPSFHFPEDFVARAKNGPEVDEPTSKLARLLDFGPTRYWQLPDLIEASVMALDLAEVVLSAAASPGNYADPVIGGPTVAEPRGDEKSKGGRKHKRTVDGLNVDQWVAAMAAADPSFRTLSQREAAKLGTFGDRTIGTCELWIQMKAQLEAENRERAERAEAELADRQTEDEDVGGLRRSSTKRGTGRQRATHEDLEHEVAVDAFLRSKSEQPRKKRAK